MHIDKQNKQRTQLTFYLFSAMFCFDLVVGKKSMYKNMNKGKKNCSKIVWILKYVYILESNTYSSHRVLD